MRLLFFVIFGLYQTSALAQILVIQRVNVISMTSAQLQPAQDVWIENDKIVAIQPSGTAFAQTADLQIDGRGKYLIPGLIDTHVHQHRMTLQDPLTLFKLYIANGVTSVCNMAAFPGQDIPAIKAASLETNRIAPWYYSSGPHLDSSNLRNLADVHQQIQQLYQTAQRLTLALSQAGVPLLAGSDNLGFHIGGFSLHDELEQLQLAGLSPYQALQSATITAARFLGRQAIAGTIEVGKNAELVLLDANPLLDIRASRQISAVMQKGRWLNRAALDELLQQAKAERALEWPADQAKVAPFFAQP